MIDDSDKNDRPDVGFLADNLAAMPLPPARPPLSQKDEQILKKLHRQLTNAASNGTVMAADETPMAGAAIPSAGEAETSSGSAPPVVVRSHTAAILHRDGKIIFVNAAAMKILNPRDQSLKAFNAQAGLRKALRKSRRSFHHLRWRDGRDRVRRISVVSRLFPWCDGPVYMAELHRRSKDVSPVRQMALHDMPDTIADGFVALDRKGCIRSFSAGAEALFGKRPTKVIGKPFSKLIAKKHRRIAKDYIRALSGGKKGRAIILNGCEVTGRMGDKSALPLFITLGQMSGGSPDGEAFCILLRDMSRPRKIKADLRRAKRASAHKSEFLALISHELRTALNSILGFAEIMRGERFGDLGNDRYRSYANDIYQTSMHLLAILNDTLDLSRIEAGKLKLAFRPVNLAGLADDVIHMLRGQAERAGIVLRQTVARDLAPVSADERSLKQVMINLVSNAIKFTDPGGQVTVSAKLKKNGALVIRIRDTGIGMEPHDVARAMQPFTRLETRGREPRPGSGLGLPLTKALVEANNAGFHIASAPNQGTLVKITFAGNRKVAA